MEDWDETKSNGKAQQAPTSSRGAVTLLTCGSVQALQLIDNMTIETLIAKHLDSIDSAEARAAVKSRITTGTVVSTVRLVGAGQLGGRTVLASTGNKSLISMVFSDVKYSNEVMAFDGQTVTVGRFTPGTKTPFGQFLLSFDIGL